MKTLFIALVVAMQVADLRAAPPPIVLTISPLGSGSYQIIAPGNTFLGGTDAYCVLQSSTDFVAWASISTNMFPYNGYGYGVTNIVQMTNAITFYRVKAYGGVYGHP